MTRIALILTITLAVLLQRNVANANPCDGLSFAGFLECWTPHQTSDVLGRDLKLTGAAWAGHIGIYIAPSIKVLEVLNEGSVIYKSTFADFLSRSSYWGPRYYAKSQKVSHSEPEVIDAGWEQRRWTPKYTLSSTYTTGGMFPQQVWDPTLQKYVVRNVARSAKFRCDTFVVYSFLRGIGVNIARTPQLPTTTWNKLPFNYRWFGAQF